MASSKIYDFLESSTIHGLSHISRATSKAAKAAWITILVACFSMAIFMITDSYKDWQESPVSTTITTHPIKELQFPDVTICPPRETNTLVSHHPGQTPPFVTYFKLYFTLFYINLGGIWPSIKFS